MSDTTTSSLDGLIYQTPEDLALEASADSSSMTSPEELEAAFEAILFASGDPVPIERIASITGLQKDAVRKILQGMMARTQVDCSRGVTILQIKDTYTLATKPSMNSVMSILFQPRNRPPLSQAAYETLAIVAYNQPVKIGRAHV